jgi:hypothetical protein
MKSTITVVSKPGVGTYKIIRDSFPDAIVINCATVNREELAQVDFNEKVIIFEDIDSAPLDILNLIRRLSNRKKRR